MKNNQNLLEPIPKIATHPGVLIADELDARENINQKELAHLLNVKSSFLNEIIKGKRPITPDTAILLEKALDISAEFWLKFQNQYDLDTARIKDKNILKVQNIELWNIIKDYVPVNAFKKLGHLSDDIEKNIQKIFEIFKVLSVDDLITQFAKRKFSLYRKSPKLTIDEKNLFSWSALAEYEASLVKVNPFDNEKSNQLIRELNTCFLKNKEVIENVKSILKKYGIKLLILEKFEKTPVDGYSFWSEDNPAIVLSFRHKRIDNLAFTLFHELGHIYLHLSHDKDLKFLDIDDKERTVFENEADVFSRNNLIEKGIWEEIKKHKFPLKDDLIMDLADNYKIHQAIIFGRMCFENKNYKVFTKIDKTVN